VSFGSPFFRVFLALLKSCRKTAEPRQECGDGTARVHSAPFKPGPKEPAATILALDSPGHSETLLPRARERPLLNGRGLRQPRPREELPSSGSAQTQRHSSTPSDSTERAQGRHSTKLRPRSTLWGPFQEQTPANRPVRLLVSPAALERFPTGRQPAFRSEIRCAAEVPARCWPSS